MVDKLTPHTANEERLLSLGFTQEIQDDGSSKWYAIHPATKKRVEIDPDQAWFWTEEWQAKEREADEELSQNQFEEFDNMDDFINSL